MYPTPVIVNIRTHQSPTYLQSILGKKSPISADIEEFRGIPYGVVPGRWKHSTLRESLPTDVYHAVTNGPKCPQLWEYNRSEGAFGPAIEFPSDVQESEFDCLNLLVIRPSNDALKAKGIDSVKEPLPVLVWIHGGAYGFGAATDPMWDPTNLVIDSLRQGKPIIAININYRLGLFGFGGSSAMLAEQASQDIQGLNFGIVDQKIALQWISKNISAFGGSPEKITIGGQSAGASSIHALVLDAKLNPGSPLFRGAIIQSGALGLQGPVSIQRADADIDALCRHIGVLLQDKEQSLARLRELSAEKLVQASREMNWAVYPLINDKLTLELTDDLSPILVKFGNSPTQETEESKHAIVISILMGEVDYEGSIHGLQLAAITEYSDVKAHFSSAFPTSTTAQEAMELYGLTPDISLDTIRDRLTRFLTEMEFSYPLSAGHTFLSQRQPNEATSTTPQVFHNTRAARYKVNFGNPFPVQHLHGSAHHCVDLIYAFNAFHKDLLEADKKSKACNSLTYKSDEGLIPSGKETSSIYPDNVSKSNNDLRLERQENWIDFIVDGLSNSSIDDESVLLYGRDRVSRKVLVDGDETFARQKERFAFIKAHIKEMLDVVKSTTGTTAYGRSD